MAQEALANLNSKALTPLGADWLDEPPALIGRLEGVNLAGGVHRLSEAQVLGIYQRLKSQTRQGPDS